MVCTDSLSHRAVSKCAGTLRVCCVSRLASAYLARVILQAAFIKGNIGKSKFTYNGWVNRKEKTLA